MVTVKKLGDSFLIVLFLGFIIGVGVLIQVYPDRPASFHENRALAQKPTFNMDAVLSGQYTEQFDGYFTDQFVARDFWIQGYLGWQQLTKQTFFFRYFVAEDEWIYPKPLEYFAQSSMDESIQSLQQFVADMGEHELYFFSLPGRANTIERPFPNFVHRGYDELSKDYLLERLPENGITTVKMGDIFKEKFSPSELNELYFQTDHHWNSNGIFEGYRIIHETLQETSDVFQTASFDPANYIEKCYEDEHFLGSYNKQLYRLVDSPVDKVCHILPTDFDYEQLEVYGGEVVPEKKLAWNSLYGKQLNKGVAEVEYSDIYTYDHREINIINPLKEAEQSKVLFVKDSYANPLTLLLAENFYQTTFFDIRYNSERSLYDFIEANDFDMIAFLYNDETIFASMYDFQLNKSD